MRICEDGVHYTSEGCYDVSVRIRECLLGNPNPVGGWKQLNVEEWKVKMDEAAQELSKQLNENMSFGGSEKNYKMVNYTYGEILPETVEQVFRGDTNLGGLKVADLGSGCGGGEKYTGLLSP